MTILLRFFRCLPPPCEQENHTADAKELRPFGDNFAHGLRTHMRLMFIVTNQVLDHSYCQKENCKQPCTYCGCLYVSLVSIQFHFLALTGPGRTSASAPACRHVVMHRFSNNN